MSKPVVAVRPPEFNGSTDRIGVLSSVEANGVTMLMPIKSMDHLSDLILALKQFQRDMTHPIPFTVLFVQDRVGRVWCRNNSNKDLWVLRTEADGVVPQFQQCTEPDLLKLWGPVRPLKRDDDTTYEHKQ